MPTSLALRKAASREPLGEVLVEPPESLARGTLSEGFPTNVGDLHVSAGWRYRAVEGNQDRRDGRGGVLEARSTEESGELARRRNPLEGRGGHRDVPIRGYMATRQ